MIIREADIENDALAITEGAHKFAKKMALGNLVADDFLSSFSRIAALDGIKILLAEDKGRVAGGIGVYVAPYIWNKDLLVADELFWWVEDNAPFRAATMLFDAIMKEIDEAGAIPIFKELQNSPRGVRKMYEKHGMQPIETTHSRLQ